MNSLRNQAGFSPLGWLLFAIVIGFIALFAFRVSGAYIDDILVIQKKLKQLGKQEDVMKMSARQIKSDLGKQFTIDRVPNEVVESIEVEKTAKTKFVRMNYEVRVPFIYNIDLIMSFENELDLSAPELCCTPRESKK